MRLRLSLFLFTAAACINMQASTLQFQTGPGTLSAAGNPVDALITVTTSANTISVELQNLVSDPLAVDQVISGVSFDLNLADTNAINLTSSAGQLIQTPVQGQPPSNDTTDTINNWAVSSSPGSNTTQVVLTSFLGSGPPSDGVIGLPGMNGDYNNANNSITNGHASPFILGQGAFAISLDGVTTDTKVSNIVFTVGTSKTDTVTASVVTPEPSSLSMIGLSALFIGLGVTRRKSAR